VNLPVPHHVPHFDRELLRTFADIGLYLLLLGALALIFVGATCDTALVTG